MNRPLTALFAALEALLVVGIGIGIPLVPLTIMWAAQYGLQIDWLVFWRAAVDIWLLGSGTDMTVVLDPSAATTLGFADAGTPVTLTIAALGFAALTMLLGVRAGRRVAETSYRVFGALVAIGTFGVLAFAVTMTALHPFARPSIWQGTLMPTLAFGAGVAIGAEITRRRRGLPDPIATRVREWLDGVSPYARLSVASALKGGTAAAAAVMATASLLVAVMLLLGYARIVGLYESVHAGVLGGVAVTVGQLAFVPNFVIWAASWLVGPGFAIGTGSAVSPLGTSLGPVPAIPVLGALPTGDLTFGFLGLLVPVLAGFFAGVLIRQRLADARGTRRGHLVATGVGAGVVGGIVLGLLAWFSAGSAGPGRLVDVGPSPWLVALFATLEIGVAAVIGILAGRVREPEPAIVATPD